MIATNLMIKQTFDKINAMNTSLKDTGGQISNNIANTKSDYINSKISESLFDNRLDDTETLVRNYQKGLVGQLTPISIALREIDKRLEEKKDDPWFDATKQYRDEMFAAYVKVGRKINVVVYTLFDAITEARTAEPLMSFIDINLLIKQLSDGIKIKQSGLEKSYNELISQIKEDKRNYLSGVITREVYDGKVKESVTALDSLKLSLGSSMSAFQDELAVIDHNLGLSDHDDSFYGPTQLYRDQTFSDFVGLGRNINALNKTAFTEINNAIEASSVNVELHGTVLYPPVPVFPRSPQLDHWIQPQSVTDRFDEAADTIESRTGKSVSSRKDSLEFALGVGGLRNVIKLSYPPYLNYLKYNYVDNTWVEKPIELVIDGNENVMDITNYGRKDVVSFPTSAAGLNDRIDYYFDGEKIITNFDFSNPEDRKRVSVRYTKLVRSLRVKAVMMANSPGMTTRTPTIDQYVMIVGKQKVLN